MIREARASDRDAIATLRRRCFPEQEASEFPTTRAFIAEESGHPIAHLGLIEQAYVVDGETYAGVLACDAMTDPAFRRRGLFREVTRFTSDAIRNDYALSTAWQIRKAVLPAMIAGGWNPVLRAPVLVKPVLFRGRPGIERHDAALALRESFLAPYAHARHGARFGARYSVTGDGGAYLVTRQTVLRGKRTLAIVDLAGDVRALIRDAIARSDEPLAAALISWRHPCVPQLLTMGFLPSPHRFRFLVNVFDPRIVLRRARWALTWADTDHL